MKHLLSNVLILLFVISFPSYAAIEGEQVDYNAEGVTLKGYLAYDTEITGKRPGVLVVHEWWGHNEYARQRARMLAELGYTALAVDMYGDGKNTAHPSQAKEFMMAVMNNMPVAKARFMAAQDFLKKQDTVDGNKIAAIGYCFGGGIVLAMARAGIDLNGVASFHGSLGTTTPAEVGRVKAKVLVLHGNADKFISPEQVKAFKQEMENAKVDFEFIGYPGVEHSFTNPEADKFAKELGIPVAYDKTADEASWKTLQDFLTRIFAD
jgi:dienelactone hydrolase